MNLSANWSITFNPLKKNVIKKYKSAFNLYACFPFHQSFCGCLCPSVIVHPVAFVHRSLCMLLPLHSVIVRLPMSICLCEAVFVHRSFIVFLRLPLSIGLQLELVALMHNRLVSVFVCKPFSVCKENVLHGSYFNIFLF